MVLAIPIMGRNTQLSVVVVDLPRIYNKKWDLVSEEIAVLSACRRSFR